MDQRTIDAMMKRAKARGGDTLATPAYAACKRALAKDVLALIEENAKLTRELDAYKKAKAENDERFMRERDEARAEVERMRSLVKSSNQLCADAIDARDGALRDARILEDGAAGWQAENAILTQAVEAARPVLRAAVVVESCEEAEDRQALVDLLGAVSDLRVKVPRPVLRVLLPVGVIEQANDGRAGTILEGLAPLTPAQRATLRRFLDKTAREIDAAQLTQPSKRENSHG